jgi:hypothetical protein
MRILDLGQNLFINPDYLVKLEKNKLNINDRIMYSIDVFLFSGYGYGNIEKLVFDTAEKRDDYLIYLFKYINNEILK